MAMNKITHFVFSTIENFYFVWISTFHLKNNKHTKDTHSTLLSHRGRFFINKN